ncbi:hypothetical protein CSKR_202816 [Clonorchis sinensis]|uniref:Uncharacterized protein n=1 Tax=Clonorchis sinensis TaxID=79923 RepID=A0A8T1M3Y0_CLOSI|nr:hypothetical protein CSKR_202816 [Clonorchis sinensis]
MKTSATMASETQARQPYSNSPRLCLGHGNISSSLSRNYSPPSYAGVGISDVRSYSTTDSSLPSHRLLCPVPMCKSILGSETLPTDSCRQSTDFGLNHCKTDETLRNTSSVWSPHVHKQMRRSSYKNAGDTDARHWPSSFTAEWTTHSPNIRSASQTSCGHPNAPSRHPVGRRSCHVLRTTRHQRRGKNLSPEQVAVCARLYFPPNVVTQPSFSSLLVTQPFSDSSSLISINLRTTCVSKQPEEPGKLSEVCCRRHTQAFFTLGCKPNKHRWF